jgi:dipeptidase D
MHYFYEISKFPRGSGNEGAIAEYLVNFANERNFKVRRSTEVINGKQTRDIVIEKPASGGYGHLDTVILQAHIDMVCQKIPSSKHDFEKDGIEIIEKDGKITANGTTLGADDGIGVACMLAILESSDISHPRIEALFTSDEEDGMTGAMAVTTNLVKGKRLINIDTETEGTLYYGCAGGVDANFKLPVSYSEIPKGCAFVKIEISGLLGGHSGVEIHKKHANANKLMARTLRLIMNGATAHLVSFTGGDKRNVITREAVSVVAVDEKNAAKVIEIAQSCKNTFLHEYDNIEDPEKFNLTANIVSSEETRAVSKESAEKLIAAILVIPNDVLAMHGKVDALVETSCNLGILSQEEGHFYFCSLIRSFFKSKKEYVLEQMKQLAYLIGAEFWADNSYPDWEPNPDSELIARFVRAYETVFPGASRDNLPRVESIHAGLECGYFTEKFPFMDMIACGPTITGAHTPEETLDKASTEKVLALLLAVLNQTDEAAPPLASAGRDKAAGEHAGNGHICRCIR